MANSRINLESLRQNVAVQVRTAMLDLRSAEEQLAGIEDELRDLLLAIPLPPDADVPVGTSADDNVELRVWKPEGERGLDPARPFAEQRGFAPKTHIELLRDLDLCDFERGVKVAGSRSYSLTGDGMLLHQAALRYGFDFMAQRHGFLPRSVPALVRELRRHAPELDIQLLEMMSSQQIEALKTGRIDIGFGRLRRNDPAVERTVLREERLVLAIAPGSRLAGSDAPLAIAELAQEELILYPREPRPSFADQVLALLEDNAVHPASVHEVSEMQTALGLVAAEMGVCIIPYAASRHRADLQYRRLADDHATSPVILSHRRNDDSPYLALVKRLLQEMYSEGAEWMGGG